MLAPYCEAETAEPIIKDLGLKALPLWTETFPDLKTNGTLVLAKPRDRSELKQFARNTIGHRWLEGDEITELEPDLGERYQTALFFKGEAHLDPRKTMQALLGLIEDAGVTIRLGETITNPPKNDTDLVIDCTGMGAGPELKDLRGVRGEMAIIKSNEISLHRPVRLLHPRFPLYVVPWGNGHYMLGATIIERSDDGPVTVRSALDLLGMAYALHPSFGEAEILELGAGTRPAFPDNTPKIVLRGRHIYINGLYRHGFLLAPILAKLTKHYIDTGEIRSELMVED